ncbi:F-box/kelch-repeat protein At3g23880-like [Silene latifolia]|uniref:F-box/kelch-repeat protein At3g23880-like n=1 Tax=Silene latifolia TaxID=37657 RepID=UPI003D778419
MGHKMEHDNGTEDLDWFPNSDGGQSSQMDNKCEIDWVNEKVDFDIGKQYVHLVGSCNGLSLDSMTETNKKDDVIAQQRYLSDDLIIHEILTRLPVTSILRFKSVSKLWHSTLSSSKFARFHLMKFPLFRPSAPVNTLFIESLNDRYLFSYDDQNSSNLEDNLVKLADDDMFGVKYYLIFTGCCNGLICLNSLGCEYFILWNPATRKWFKYASDECLMRFDWHDYLFMAHGFGYTSSDDDYKYVRILETTQPSYIVHVFSLRKNKWRKIEFDDDDVVILYRRAVLVDEKLYWGGHYKQAKRKIGEKNWNLFVRFDLGLEKFDIIQLNGDDFVGKGGMGGCLSGFNLNFTSTYDELIMQIMESTVVQKTFVFPKETIYNLCQIIGYTRTGDFFVTGNFIVEEERLSETTLWLVESGMKPVQYKALMKFEEPVDNLDIVKYVPSLVSPFPIEELSEARADPSHFY